MTVGRCFRLYPPRRRTKLVFAAPLTLGETFGLGCTRKYVTLLNGNIKELIVSFSCFQNVIEEAGELLMSEGYWRYLQLRLHQMERQWLEQTQDTEGARPNKRRSAPMSGRI